METAFYKEKCHRYQSAIQQAPVSRNMFQLIETDSLVDRLFSQGLEGGSLSKPLRKPKHLCHKQLPCSMSVQQCVPPKSNTATPATDTSDSACLPPTSLLTSSGVVKSEETAGISSVAEHGEASAVMIEKKELLSASAVLVTEGKDQLSASLDALCSDAFSAPRLRLKKPSRFQKKKLTEQSLYPVTVKELLSDSTAVLCSSPRTTNDTVSDLKLSACVCDKMIEDAQSREFIGALALSSFCSSLHHTKERPSLGQESIADCRVMTADSHHYPLASAAKPSLATEGIMVSKGSRKRSLGSSVHTVTECHCYQGPWANDGIASPSADERRVKFGNFVDPKRPRLSQVVRTGDINQGTENCTHTTDCSATSSTCTGITGCLVTNSASTGITDHTATSSTSTGCKATSSTSTDCTATSSTSTDCTATSSTSTGCKATSSTSTDCTATSSTSTDCKATSSTSTDCKATSSTSTGITDHMCTATSSTSTGITDCTATSSTSTTTSTSTEIADCSATNSANTGLTDHTATNSTSTDFTSSSTSTGITNQIFVSSTGITDRMSITSTGITDHTSSTASTEITDHTSSTSTQITDHTSSTSTQITDHTSSTSTGITDHTSSTSTQITDHTSSTSTQITDHTASKITAGNCILTRSRRKQMRDLDAVTQQGSVVPSSSPGGRHGHKKDSPTSSGCSRITRSWQRRKRTIVHRKTNLLCVSCKHGFLSSQCLLCLSVSEAAKLLVKKASTCQRAGKQAVKPFNRFGKRSRSSTTAHCGGQRKKAVSAEIHQPVVKLRCLSPATEKKIRERNQIHFQSSSSHAEQGQVERTSSEHCTLPLGQAAVGGGRKPLRTKEKPGQASKGSPQRMGRAAIVRDMQQPPQRRPQRLHGKRQDPPKAALQLSRLKQKQVKTNSSLGDKSRIHSTAGDQSSHKKSLKGCRLDSGPRSTPLLRNKPKPYDGSKLRDKSKLKSVSNKPKLDSKPDYKARLNSSSDGKSRTAPAAGGMKEVQVLEHHKRLSSQTADNPYPIFTSAKDVFSQLCQLEQHAQDYDSKMLDAVMPQALVVGGCGRSVSKAVSVYCSASTSSSHVGGIWKSIFSEK